MENIINVGVNSWGSLSDAASGIHPEADVCSQDAVIYLLQVESEDERGFLNTARPWFARL